MPSTAKPLYLHEEVFLLALRDDQGTVAFGVLCEIAIGGAVLAELLLGGRIEIESGKRASVNLVDNRPFGDQVLDDCLTRIATAKRRAKLGAWVSRLGHVRGLKHRVAQGLCVRGILREDEDRVLLLFRRKIYPEIDPRPERKLIERLRRAVLSPGGRVEPRTVVLLSLAKSAGLLKTCFERRELKNNKRRIEELVSGELAGRATKEAVQAAQAAAAMAAIIPAVTVATIST